MGYRDRLIRCQRGLYFLFILIQMATVGFVVGCWSIGYQQFTLNKIGYYKQSTNLNITNGCYVNNNCYQFIDQQLNNTLYFNQTMNDSIVLASKWNLYQSIVASGLIMFALSITILIVGIYNAIKQSKKYRLKDEDQSKELDNKYFVSSIMGFVCNLVILLVPLVIYFSLTETEITFKTTNKDNIQITKPLQNYLLNLSKLNLSYYYPNGSTFCKMNGNDRSWWCEINSNMLTKRIDYNEMETDMDKFYANIYNPLIITWSILIIVTIFIVPCTISLYNEFEKITKPLIDKFDDVDDETDIDCDEKQV